MFLRKTIRLMMVTLAASATSLAGVNISSPKNGAVTNSPLHVAASATPNSSAPIKAIQIYVDGGLVYNAGGSTVDTFLNLGYGNHMVVVQAWDAAGATYKAPVYVVGSGSGVFLSSPGANAVVNGSAHVKATAYSPNHVHVMQIYDNGNLVNQTPGASVDTTIPVSPGSHYLVVKAWDNNGTQFMDPVLVTTSGTSTSSSNAPPPATQQAPPQDAPQAWVAPNASAKVDVDQMGGWENCGACSGINANGPVVPYSMTQGINSPSLDGKSAIFWIGGDKPWGSAIWWKQLGANDGATHFVYDLEFFLKDPGVSQALEFDVNQTVGGKKYIFGTECDIRSGNAWRVWDTINAHWMSTGASCHVNGNSWNHLTWEMERVGDKTHFIAVTMNGYRQTIDKYYTAKPWGGRELNVAFQMDGDEHMDDYQVWLDRVRLYAW
jgi:hypothetical protein